MEQTVKFPELWRFTSDDFPQMYGVFNVYDKGEIKHWLKQCMDDFPDRASTNMSEDDLFDYGTLCEGWFNKWFTQFDSLAGTVKEKNPMEQAIERMKNRK